jgi:hypothetical protein
MDKIVIFVAINEESKEFIYRNFARHCYLVGSDVIGSAPDGGMKIDFPHPLR